MFIRNEAKVCFARCQSLKLLVCTMEIISCPFETPFVEINDAIAMTTNNICIINDMAVDSCKFTCNTEIQVKSLDPAGKGRELDNYSIFTIYPQKMNSFENMSR